MILNRFSLSLLASLIAQQVVAQSPLCSVEFTELHSTFLESRRCERYRVQALMCDGHLLPTYAGFLRFNSRITYIGGGPGPNEGCVHAIVDLRPEILPIGLRAPLEDKRHFQRGPLATVLAFKPIHTGFASVSIEQLNSTPAMYGGRVIETEGFVCHGIKLLASQRDCLRGAYSSGITIHSVKSLIDGPQKLRGKISYLPSMPVSINVDKQATVVAEDYSGRTAPPMVTDSMVLARDTEFRRWRYKSCELPSELMMVSSTARSSCSVNYDYGLICNDKLYLDIDGKEIRGAVKLFGKLPHENDGCFLAEVELSSVRLGKRKGSDLTADLVNYYPQGFFGVFRQDRVTGVSALMRRRFGTGGMVLNVSGRICSDEMTKAFRLVDGTNECSETRKEHYIRLVGKVPIDKQAGIQEFIGYVKLTMDDVQLDLDRTTSIGGEPFGAGM
jgi:hypothetical protein